MRLPSLRRFYLEYLGAGAAAGGYLEDLLRCHGALVRCFRRGGKLLVAGNGGSFADSLHLCAELLKAFRLPRPLNRRVAAAVRRLPEGKHLVRSLDAGLPAIALGTNGALVTAIINDKANANLVFAQEVAALGRRGDVFLGISTSGEAEDILLALRLSQACGLLTIGLTGQAGGRLAREADIAIRAPGTSTAAVQEAHSRIYHALCAGLEQCFWPPRR
ncbi:MAG: SIS domain-containing protein [Planctomycetota bacterium]|nr:SIS domain-containing protein [Planctomycetota bacterium]